MEENALLIIQNMLHRMSFVGRKITLRSTLTKQTR